jgi:hypothetical protein
MLIILTVVIVCRRRKENASALGSTQATYFNPFFGAKGRQESAAVADEAAPTVDVLQRLPYGQGGEMTDVVFSVPLEESGSPPNASDTAQARAPSVYVVPSEVPSDETYGHLASVYSVLPGSESRPTVTDGTYAHLTSQTTPMYAELAKSSESDGVYEVSGTPHTSYSHLTPSESVYAGVLPG